VIVVSLILIIAGVLVTLFFTSWVNLVIDNVSTYYYLFSFLKIYSVGSTILLDLNFCLRVNLNPVKDGVNVISLRVLEAGGVVARNSRVRFSPVIPR
jgi:hypothetical protein